MPGLLSEMAHRPHGLLEVTQGDMCHVRATVLPPKINLSILQELLYGHFAAAGGRWFGVLALTIGWLSPMNFRTVLMVSSFKLLSRELSLPMLWTSLGGAVNQDNLCTWTISTMLVTLTVQ